MHDSLLFLCDDATYSNVLRDVDELIDFAKQKQFKPIILVIGSVFLEILCAKLVKDSLKLKKNLLSNKVIRDAFRQKLLEKRFYYYSRCENNHGKIGLDRSRNVVIFYNPDETYLSIQCVDGSRKAVQAEACSGDGYPICSLKFKDTEDLRQIFGSLVN